MTEKTTMPAIALRGLTIFPGMIIHFDLSREKSISAVEKAMMNDQKVFLVTQKSADTENPDIDDVFTIGTIAEIKQISKLPNKIVRILVDGLEKARLIQFEESKELLIADIEPLEIQADEKTDYETDAMNRQIQEMLEEYSRYYPKAGKTIATFMEEATEPDTAYLMGLLNHIGMNLPIDFLKKQRVLECNDLESLYDEVTGILANEINVAKIRIDLTERVKGKVEKNQKEYLLREQMQFIREELGEDNPYSDADTFEEELKKLKAPKEVKEKISKEISRFKAISRSSTESSVERGYIETLLELPWDKMSKDNTDINYAEKILDEQHYGLEQIKERIVEFLAVRTLTKKGESPILCLVGPPGTGKTSIARSVAEALNKKYLRICLGGVRDEAEIRGHRKTYVGAMPGRIAAGLRQVGVKNPLILLDEIDKVGKDQRGDTASALLEVLDSEQNNKFRDHYVEIPLDLSEVLFIATANDKNTIPRPLLDRMEILEVSSYTANEKFHIAKEHLLDKQLKKNGLDHKQLKISDQALKLIISGYTREAGVRELERKIGQICKKTAKEILKDNKKSVQVNAGNLKKYLGKIRYTLDRVNTQDEVGIVRGLAWTSVGGDTLQVEVNMMPGKGEIDLTGQLGDVMKESAKAGMSYIRSVSEKYQIDSKIFKENDFHIHIPQGAVPKDGPSAGITMATALLSVITGKKVRACVAMTGEITLRGRVLPIGGLKEKILAAKMAGITKVLVPKENEKDVEEISKEITADIEIVYVSDMETVLEHALVSD